MGENEVMVRRGNVYLRIPEYQIKEYLAKGFDVIDDNGNVVQASVPNDVNALKVAYVELTNRVKELEEELKAVKAKKTTKVPEKPTEDAKPKRTTTKKKAE